ncbi:hypothetical protein IAU60_004157 [Kwoniella sp. DSM 27419]
MTSSSDTSLKPGLFAPRGDPTKVQNAYNDVANRRIAQGEVTKDELRGLLDASEPGVTVAYTGAAVGAVIGSAWLLPRVRRIGIPVTIMGIMGGVATGLGLGFLAGALVTYQKHGQHMKDFERKWTVLEEINTEARAVVNAERRNR